VSAGESVELRRTALYDEHVALGARMVPFGGFSMPVQYAGILKEHDAVRHRAGLFDLSHMAQFELAGDGAAAWADALTVNAVATMKPYQARYNIFTNASGGALDDVLFYRLPDRYLIVVNAANAVKMWSYLTRAADGRADVRLTNRHGERALVALQGPRAAAIAAPLCDVDLATLRYYFCIEATVAGVHALVARTGYTGEDGFELFVDGADAPHLWRTLLARGADAGLVPAGLGARDVLRLEAGMPLYGHELTETISPLAAGQGWAVRRDKTFVGSAALEAQLADDTYRRIVGIVLAGRAPAREGYAVFHGGRRVGEIRSASIAPAVGNANVATALVEKAAAAVGTSVDVEIRGMRYAATVVALPFYKRPAENKR
jgi:aminomethyltransferase